MQRIVSFEIEDELLEKVDEIADRFERTRSFIFRKAIEKYVAEVIGQPEEQLEKLSV